MQTGLDCQRCKPRWVELTDCIRGCRRSTIVGLNSLKNKWRPIGWGHSTRNLAVRVDSRRSRHFLAIQRVNGNFSVWRLECHWQFAGSAERPREKVDDRSDWETGPVSCMTSGRPVRTYLVLGIVQSSEKAEPRYMSCGRGDFEGCCGCCGRLEGWNLHLFTETLENQTHRPCVIVELWNRRRTSSCPMLVSDPWAWPCCVCVAESNYTMCK